MTTQDILLFDTLL